jgi:O-antigen/teichoic acid export membrane protein
MSDAPEQLPRNLSSHPPHRRQFFTIAHAIEKEAMAQVPVSGNLDREGNQGMTNQVDVPGQQALPLPGIPYKEAGTLLGPRVPAQAYEEAQTLLLPSTPNRFPSVPARPQKGKPASRNGVWEPGTFGFNDTSGSQYAVPMPNWLETLPMMVLTGISQAQGESKPVMQSEISGAAGAAGLVGLGNILGTVFKYISTFLIQYAFGPGIYGLYTLATSLVNLVSSVFNLGLDDAMVRYVAIYRAKKKATSLQGLTIFCTSLAGIAGLVGALLLLFFTPSLMTLDASLHVKSFSSRNSFAQVVPVLQMMAPLVPLFCMQIVWVGGLRGFKAFKWRVLSASILQPVALILLLLGVIFFFHELGIYGVAIALLVSTAFSVVLNLFFLFRQVSRVATAESKQYEVREWLGFASLNFLTTIIDTVLDSIDTILLAVFSIPFIQIGQYGAAIRYSIFISVPLLSLNNIFAPTIAELHSKGERRKLASMFKVVTKWTISFSLPIFLIVTLFSPYLLGLSGPDFVPAWPLLIAFAIGGLINAGTGAVGYMLLMTGYNKLSFINSLVAVATNIGLGIVLTPRYGAMGTAISTGLAICVLNLMRLLQVRLILKMQPYRRDTLKPLCAGLISALLIGGALFLLRDFKLSRVLGHAILPAQLLLIPIFLAIYVELLILFKGSPEDEIVIQSLRKKFLRGKNGKKHS